MMLRHEKQAESRRRPYILFWAARADASNFFDEQARDNCQEPFIALRRRCEELGYVLEFADDQPLEQCEWIVFWDVNSLGPTDFIDYLIAAVKRIVGGATARNLFQEALSREDRPKLALIVAEPPSILRKNVSSDPHSLMDVVLTWNRDWWQREGKYVETVLPVASAFPPVKPVSFRDKKLLVDISGNKFSHHPSELYSKRREAIRYFERRFPSDFDLYGVGWNERRRFPSLRQRDSHHYTAYRGPVIHKWDVLPGYRFAICYENAIFQDYVSQRIFDVLRSNCVPVYWGAPNIEEYVDRDAFVDRRDFSSNEELADFLMSVEAREYEQMIEAARRFLQGPRFRRFTSEQWGDNLLGALGIGKGA